MDRSALNAARVELQRSRDKLATLRASDSIDQTVLLWSEFLIAANRVFSKIEHGAKVGPAKGWYDRVRHTRRTDPLLKYIQAARNADEHGIGPITRRSQGLSIGGRPGEKAHIRDLRISDNKISFSGDGVTVRLHPPEARLVAVKNRGTWYPPPLQHLGNPLADQSPVAVAELALSFLEKVVGEAASV